MWRRISKRRSCRETEAGRPAPPERDLKNGFDVGCPTTREALIPLQKAGLVELTNGARARVKMATASHIFSSMAPAVRQMLSTEAGQGYFQGARLFSEVGLAREAALHATGAGAAARRR
jgi:GntR family transcriptional regulator, sialic acid-inducible nan operon repressor